MSEFNKLCKELEDAIKSAYEQGVSMDEAERLSAKFLYAQMAVSGELSKIDLDSRMRKSGLKAIKAAVYQNLANPVEGKKPTVDALDYALSLDENVSKAQDEFDAAEVVKLELERLYNVFREGHIFMRGIAKGTNG